MPANTTAGIRPYPERSNGHARDGGVPDLQAAKHIPITAVIAALGLERHGSMIRCWRPDAHQHGDRTPSAGIHHQRNRVKCFCCDARSLSTVDLVGSVLGLDTFPALLWLNERFQLPRTQKGKHLVRRGQYASPGRVGVSANRLEPLVRSGLYAAMSEAEIRTLTALDIFADREADRCTLSYAALRRFCGIQKDRTIAKALRKLENMGAIQRIRGRGGNGLNVCNTYRLTLEDARFLHLLRHCQEETQREISVEREARAIRRSSLSGAHSQSQGGARAITGIKPVPPSGAVDINFPRPFKGSGKFAGITKIAVFNGKSEVRPN